MTKTIIIPENNSVLISIPEEYIGKKLEVLMYSLEELAEIQPAKNTMKSYKGILTSEESTQLQQFVKQSREEWNSNI